MKKYKVGLISLGCDKNRIDSEIILGKLKEDFEIVNDPNIADIIIVNTCGFIEDSKQESINTILEMAKYKEKNCKILIATGCLTQRYKDELLKLMPELDLMFGVNDYDKLVKSIHDYLKNNEKKMYCSYSDKIINEGDRIVTTEGATAYIRIAEGCNNFCAYCIIPKIRGKYRSRSIENIVDEAKKLAQNGCKELILVAQDTTKYGIDIYGKKMLPILIKKISEIEEIKWIRVLYSYPEEITDELIQEIKNNDKVCKYLDMPIQHINDDVLRNMRRKSRKEQVINVLRKFRKEIPSICLRTSLIVGFPGETEEQFNELLEFVKEIQFNKLGVFEYSREEDTKAYEMNNQIEEDIKRIRKEKIMIEQQKISKKQNEEKVGKVYEVIVDGFNGEYLFGRSYEMSPEIDGTIFIKYDKIVKNGDIIKVKIIKSLEYDLIGVVYNEYSE